MDTQTLITIAGFIVTAGATLAGGLGGVYLGWRLTEKSHRRWAEEQHVRAAVRAVLDALPPLVAFITAGHGCGLAAWEIRCGDDRRSSHLERARLDVAVHCLACCLSGTRRAAVLAAAAVLDSDSARANREGALAALATLRDSCLKL